jgi:hypothetical protein
MPRFVVAASLMLVCNAVIEADNTEELEARISGEFLTLAGDWDLEKFRCSDARMSTAEVRNVRIAEPHQVTIESISAA